MSDEPTIREVPSEPEGVINISDPYRRWRIEQLAFPVIPPPDPRRIVIVTGI